MDNITPKKCLIVANGVRNHNEFVDLVKERVSEILPVPESDYLQRETTKYIGGDTRIWSETPSIQLQVAFESVPWTHEDTAAFFVMNTILGSA